MRSKKPLPGSELTLIISSSEMIFVPPVTELATSEPGSLSTGADSPVIADSSTEATPSMTSPSAGIISPATTLIVSPLCRLVELTSSISPLGKTFLAVVSDLVDRKESAWALLLPSATASAKLANKIVRKRITLKIQINMPYPYLVPPKLFAGTY